MYLLHKDAAFLASHVKIVRCCPPTNYVWFFPRRSGTRLDTRLVAFGAFAGYAGVRMTQRLFKRGVLSNEKKPTKLH